MRGNVEVLQAACVIGLVCSASTNKIERAKANPVNDPLRALEQAYRKCRFGFLKAEGIPAFAGKVVLGPQSTTKDRARGAICEGQISLSL
jgi:hypothetical protein